MNSLQRNQIPPTPGKAPDVPSNVPFGELVYERRVAMGLTQAELSKAASISTGYLSGLENGRRLPPPRRTAARIGKALQLDKRQSTFLVAAAVRERGSERPDEDLPSEVRLLISDLRIYAFKLPERFVNALRAKVKEAAM